MREKLIAFRAERSQQEMAEIYNVSQQAWSKWERGVGFPRLPLLLRLEADAGVPINELFFDHSNNLMLSESNNPNSAA